MGRSITVHCIGYGPIVSGKSQLFYAMNRLEIQQKAARAKRDGTCIDYWFAQTAMGQRILGGWTVEHGQVPRVPTITCPVCDARGCSVCEYSGITTRAWIKGYKPWQLAQIAKEIKTMPLLMAQFQTEN